MRPRAGLQFGATIWKLFGNHSGTIYNLAIRLDHSLGPSAIGRRSSEGGSVFGLDFGVAFGSAFGILFGVVFRVVFWVVFGLAFEVAFEVAFWLALDSIGMITVVSSRYRGVQGRGYGEGHRRGHREMNTQGTQRIRSLKDIATQTRSTETITADKEERSRSVFLCSFEMIHMLITSSVAQRP